MTIADKIEKHYRSVDLEHKVLAYLFKRDPSQSIDLSHDYFTSESNRKLFDLILRIATPMDQESVKLEFDLHRDDSDEVLKERITRIFAIDVDDVSPRTFKLQSKELFQIYGMREMMNGCLKLVSKGAKMNITREDTIDEIRHMFQVATTPFLEKDRSADFLEDYDDRKEAILADIERLKEMEANGQIASLGVPTGLNQFDTVTGGVMPSEFGVIAGKTNVGKTAALISFGVHAWRSGKNVLFVSGEMSRKDIMHRIDSAVSVVPAMLFRTKEFTDEYLEQWDDSITELKSEQDSFFEVVSFDSSTFDCSIIEATIDKVEDKHKKKVDLVCIDYINILSAVSSKSDGGTKDWREQSKAVWDLKLMTASRDIAVWTAGQVTDEGMGSKRLKLNHLKYSRAISEAAPIVVGLVRDREKELDDTMTLQIVKMRNAPCDDSMDIELHPNFDVSILHEEESNPNEEDLDA